LPSIVVANIGVNIVGSHASEQPTTFAATFTTMAAMTGVDRLNPSLKGCTEARGATPGVGPKDPNGALYGRAGLVCVADITVGHNLPALRDLSAMRRKGKRETGPTGKIA
jgi:hypothetical protein